MSSVGVALLGLGRAGSFHLASLAAIPDARLRAVFDVDGARAAEVAEQTGARAAADAKAAIQSDDVDAVLVATPTRSHHGYVVAALEAGKAVLSEKPLGVDLDEIDRCFALAKERGRPLLVAFQRRFDPSFASVAERARAGAVGESAFIRSVSRDSPVPSAEYIRTSGGFFHDCAVHDFDLVCHIAGVPEEVFAWASSFVPEIAAEGDVDNAVVVLRFPSGLLATVDVNRRSVYGYDQRLEVFGSGGMLQSGNRPETATVRAGPDGFTAPPIQHSFPTRYRDAYREEVVCFLDCVRGRREVPITHEDVRLTYRVADAAARSVREGRPVHLDEMD